MHARVRFSRGNQVTVVNPVQISRCNRIRSLLRTLQTRAQVQSSDNGAPQ